MKKKRLFTLLMAGMLAASSPTAVFAAEFSDSEFSDSGAAEADAGYGAVLPDEEALPGAGNPVAETLPEAEEILSDGEAIQSDELFQSASQDEVEIFSSEQDNPGDEAGDTDISDGDFEEYVTLDNVSYQYMEDKDSYYVKWIRNLYGETIVVRSEINGKKVTEIGPYVYDASLEEHEFYETTGDLILPDGLQVIQHSAFDGSCFLSLHIPDSVTEIQVGAFSNTDVRFIHFPASMTVIPEGVIGSCSKLETIEIPEGVVELAPGAFNRCVGLKKIYLPKSMTKIGEDLFAKNAKVTIIAPEGSYAEEYAREHGLNFFAGEEPAPEPGQENVTLGGVCYTYQKSSDSYLVTDYSGDIPEEVIIPDTVLGKSVTGIGERAFIDCYRIRRVVLPDTLQNIGKESFLSCINLREIILPDGLKSIGDYAFKGLTLKQVLIPDSVKSLGEGVFYGASVEEVRLPENMTSLPVSTFSNAGVSSSLTLPSGLKSIGSYAFNNCRVKEVVLPSSLTSIGDFAFNCSKIESITIPNSVTKMGKNVFENCKNLRNVQWGKGLKTVPDNTFRKCGLEDMTLPNTVTTIGSNAYSSSALRRLTIPKSVKSINKNAFGSCNNLTFYVVKGSYGETFAKNNKISYINGTIDNSIVKQDGIRYEYQPASKDYAVIEADKNLEGDIVISGTIKGKKVTFIDLKAFSACENIRSVKLPDTIKTIKDYAFSECTSLEQVYFSASLTSIGGFAFDKCTALKQVNFPVSLKTIGERAFGMCSSLEQVDLPSSLTSIGNNAFIWSGLKSVTIPASVKTIGKSAFARCEKLEEIHFSKGLTEIPDSLCTGCYNLSKVTLPDTLKQIDANAFENCGLTSIDLPGSLKRIEGGAFENCNFTSVELPDTLETLGMFAFAYCDSLKQVTIPANVKMFTDSFTNCTALEKIEILTGVEVIDRYSFEGCNSLKEIHIPESVYSIGENHLPDGCVIYGKSGSVAENFANSNGYTFVSDGEAVLSAPVLAMERFDGNCIHIIMSKRGYNAESYEYVLSKDKNFPKSGKYVARQKLAGAEEQKLDFKLLDKGSYYTFARSVRTLKDGKTEYSSWSKPVLTVVSTQAPKSPTVKSVTVKGNTVTVVLNKTAGAKGYAGVLANGTKKEGAQKLLMPDNVRYSADSSTTKLVFKNVKKGTYQLLVKGYAKQKNGAKVCSKWRARTAKIKVK
ncbi:leucine-rich repeat domain-containing protein [Blautia schinkii]|nr:leucine-rich repeat domain-containing protein [Blautia schinkii]